MPVVNSMNQDAISLLRKAAVHSQLCTVINYTDQRVEPQNTDQQLAITQNMQKTHSLDSFVMKHACIFFALNFSFNCLWIRC